MIYCNTSTHIYRSIKCNAVHNTLPYVLRASYCFWLIMLIRITTHRLFSFFFIVVRLLITEAEKAAKALEVAASKSPLARASLLETRKLIAKATRSIEGIKHGQIPMQDTAEDVSSDSAISETSAGSQTCEDILDERLINGEVHLFSSNNGSYKDLDKSTLQVVLNGRELSWASDSAENSTEVFHHCHSPSSESESERKDVASINLLTGSSTVNGSIVHNKIVPARGDESL